MSSRGMTTLAGVLGGLGGLLCIGTGICIKRKIEDAVDHIDESLSAKVIRFCVSEPGVACLGAWMLSPCVYFACKAAEPHKLEVAAAGSLLLLAQGPALVQDWSQTRKHKKEQIVAEGGLMVDLVSLLCPCCLVPCFWHGYQRRQRRAGRGGERRDSADSAGRRTRGSASARQANLREREAQLREEEERQQALIPEREAERQRLGLWRSEGERRKREERAAGGGGSWGGSASGGSGGGSGPSGSSPLTSQPQEAQRLENLRQGQPKKYAAEMQAAGERATQASLGKKPPAYAPSAAAAPSRDQNGDPKPKRPPQPRPKQSSGGTSGKVAGSGGGGGGSSW
jgi:hypothetical protein